MRLLQSTWAELLTLTTAFRSLEQFGGQDDEGSGDIDSADGANEENSGLKLRYATDYWLDERLAKECGSATIGVSLSSNVSGGTTSTSSTTSGTATVTTPTVLDIFNMVSVKY